MPAYRKIFYIVYNKGSKIGEHMKHIGTKQIETDRLILRKFKLSDAEDMFKNYTSHEKVTKYLTWKPHKSIDDTRQYLREVVLPAYENLNCYRWAIVLKENGQVVGAIDAIDKIKAAHLGWVLGDKYWGRGIMPEAGKAVLEYLFEIGYERIEAMHHIENVKSGRVMQKIGMKHEGTLRKFHIDNNGRLIDCEMYSIIDRDFK